jgi:gas vesicle protein
MIKNQSSFTDNVLAGTVTVDVQPEVNVSVSTDVVKLYFSTHEQDQIIIDYELMMESGYDYDESEIVGEFEYDESSNSLSYELTGDDDIRRNRNNVIRLKVPKGLNLEVESEVNLIELDGIYGKCEISNENGPIQIKKSVLSGKAEVENGPLDVTDTEFNGEIATENGPILMKNCNGDKIDINSENGQIKLLNISYSSVTGESENGSIVCELGINDRSELDLRTENGPIKLTIPDGLIFNLEARTENAPIRTNDRRVFGAGGNTLTLNNSDAKVFITLETENAPITVIHDKHIIFKAMESELNKAEEYIQKITSEVNIDDISEKIEDSLKKVRVMFETGIDRGKKGIFSSIKNIFSDLDKDNLDELKENLREKKEEIKLNIQNVKERIKDAEQGIEEKRREKASGSTDNKESSRLKILELLEKGLISAEDAEKLLKAIDG